MHDRTETKDIKLNEREQLEYLLGNTPSWMLYYGITAILLFIIVLFTMAHFIQYPDVADAKVVLTTNNPPLRLIAKSTGKIEALLVQNQEHVQKGTLLAVLENTADYRDVLALEEALEHTGATQFRMSETLNLGNLQGIYSAFTQNSKDYSYFSTQSGIGIKVENIQKQIKALQAMNENLKRQKSIFLTEINLSTRELDRQRKLYAQGGLALNELEKLTANNLAQKRQLETNDASFISNEMQIRQAEGQINDLRQNHSDSNNNKSNTLFEDLQKLKVAISEWKATYLIIAPINGQVSFSKIWSTQQNVMIGEEVCAVVPQDATENIVIGKATLPIANSGKVKIGMLAIVRLDGLPFQQFGTIEGQIANISLIPQKEDYLLDLSFPQPLKTSYNKNVDFRQEMQGQVRIITESRSILHRIFDSWNDLFKNK